MYIGQRFYHHLDLKSEHQDAAPPPLDDSLKKITEPDPTLLAESQSAIDAFCGQFVIKENPKVIFKLKIALLFQSYHRR